MIKYNYKGGFFMKDKVMIKLQKMHDRCSARATKANKLANRVGLKGWSADSTWISDTDSRKPTMYIPDKIKNSILGNIFISPFILLFSGLPRAAIYAMATKSYHKNFDKANECSLTIESLNDAKKMLFSDDLMQERINIVENKNLESKIEIAKPRTIKIAPVFDKEEIAENKEQKLENDDEMSM